MCVWVCVCVCVCVCGCVCICVCLRGFITFSFFWEGPGPTPAAQRIGVTFFITLHVMEFRYTVMPANTYVPRNIISCELNDFNHLVSIIHPWWNKIRRILQTCRLLSCLQHVFFINNAEKMHWCGDFTNKMGWCGDISRTREGEAKQ